MPASTPENARYLTEMEIIRIIFDTERNELILVRQRITEYVNRSTTHEWDHSKNPIQDFRFWKHIGYHRGRKNEEDIVIKVTDVKDKSSREAKFERSRNIINPFKKAFNDYGVRDSDFQLFGNEIYLIYGGKSGFTVWCFDKNIEMANENHRYWRVREIGKSSHVNPLGERVDTSLAMTE